MSVNNAVFNFQGTSNDITSEVSNPVGVGQCVELRPTLVINVCGDFNYPASFSVSASPPNGELKVVATVAVI